MNPHFPQGYLVINDLDEHESGSKPWYGIMLHTETVIDTMTVNGKDINASAALLLIKDVPVGTPLLMSITKIKLSTVACKMILPN